MRTTARTPRLWRAATTVAVASALALAVSACAPGSNESNSTPDAPEATAGIDPDVEVTITVSDGWGTTGTGELFGKIIEGFEREYPNVTVERDTTDYESYSQSINLKGTSPNPPDVMMLQTAGYGQGFYQFARSGVLLPLDGYAEAYGWSERFGADSNLDVFRFDAEDGDQWGSGPLYGLPEQNAMITVFYNAELMAEAGIDEVPTTFAEFEESLATAADAGITPIAQSNVYTHTYMAMWNALEGEAGPINDWIYGRGGAFDSESGTETARTLASWQKQGYFQPGVSGATDADASGYFLNGRSLYFIAGSWMAGAVESSLAENGGAFQMPSSDGEAVPPAGGGLTTPLTISAKSEHPEVAAAFLDYFTSESTSDQLLEGGWGVPGAAVSDAVAKGPGLTNAILEMLLPIEAEGGSGTTPFLDWAVPTLTERLPAALQELTAGSVSPEEFTARIQDISDEFVADRTDG